MTDIKNIKFNSDNKYGVPDILSIEYTDCEWIPFNYAMTCKDKAGKGVHFYLDDYQFERVYNTPEKYINVLKGFDYVLSPDFSTYTNMPLIEQMYSHFKKHWCAAYWQMRGIKVISTVSWSDETSFDWCFDGEPKNSTVSVSSVGCAKEKGAKDKFILGYKKMIEVLKPEKVIFYGKVFDEIKDLCDYTEIEAHYMNVRKRCN